MPGRERFIHNVYVSGACVGTARTAIRACKVRPGARKSLKVLLEAYSGKEIERLSEQRPRQHTETQTSNACIPVSRATGVQ